MAAPADDIKQATLITAREHLEEVCLELAQHPRLAVDTESNGFYAYKERVCLIQLSSPIEDYIVDPIAFADISALGPLLADPRIEKIFHAGEYDLLCLKRDYGFRFSNIFDTMIASRVLGFKELGLAAAIERHFGIKLSKKLQRADWGKRPMTPEQLRYAQFDTHFLMRLADIQKGLLAEKGREADAAEACEDLLRVTPSLREFDPDGFWKLAGSKTFNGVQAACLREIYLWREAQARARDRAAFRVMPESLMVQLAVELPRDRQMLAQIKGMSPYLIERYSSAILAAIERGLIAEHPALPKRERREKTGKLEWELFEALRQWRKTQAEKESVESVVIVSSDALRKIAGAAARKDGDALRSLSELKRGRYGAAIEQVIQRILKTD